MTPIESLHSVKESEMQQMPQQPGKAERALEKSNSPFRAQEAAPGDRARRHKKSKQSSLLESSIEKRSSVEKKKKKKDKKDKKEKKRKHSGSRRERSSPDGHGLAESGSRRGLRKQTALERELQDTIEKITRLMETQNKQSQEL